MERIMDKVILESLTAKPANQSQKPAVIVQRRQGGELRVLDGKRRLDAQIEVSGIAEAIQWGGREVIRVMKIDGKLVEVTE